jgi:hypothetical protein
LRADWQLPLLRDGGRYRIEAATPEAVAYVARNLRACDAAELEATVGHDHHEATLALCTAGAVSAVVAVDSDDTPLGVFGVSTLSLIYNVGCPWAVATTRAQLFRSALVAVGRLYTAAMLEQYEVLENWVDARNAQSVAWLRHLGYTIGEAKPYGARSLPFHHFWIERK